MNLDFFTLAKYWHWTVKPETWCKILNVKIMDPDGWRLNRVGFEVPLTLSEFMKLATYSTVQSTNV